MAFDKLSRFGTIVLGKFPNYVHNWKHIRETRPFVVVENHGDVIETIPLSTKLDRTVALTAQDYGLTHDSKLLVEYRVMFHLQSFAKSIGQFNEVECRQIRRMIHNFTGNVGYTFAG